MSRAEMQDFLAVPQAANNRLKYVTGNDWALILGKATRRKFSKGEELIHLGKQNPTIIFVA